MDQLEELQNIKQKNALLAAIFKQNKDNERYAKSKLFADKLEKQTFTIAFAGHFSAGKSSMINALVNEQLLPTSPIPTSANIVTVNKADENYAIVHFVDQSPVKFSGEYDIQHVKKYSKDGSKVSQIEIGHKTSGLPKGITVMDTPGVDSTDDAHRVSTESALHLADIVFYVMDYNHVQSELNFQFTKQLLHYNENIYLIVNQIDKHREEELSFTAYKESVSSAFTAWNVVPKDIYYTSLKNREMLHNDFEQVKQIVNDSILHKEELFLLSATATLDKLKDEHLAFLEEEKKGLQHELSYLLTEEDWINVEEILEQFEVSEKQKKLQESDAWKKVFESNRKEILSNASIMTYEIREKLKSYAESRQDNFKVGFLSSKKKTEQERNNRLTETIELLETIVSTHITAHIKNLMKRMLKDVGLLNDSKTSEINNMSFSLPSEIIVDTIHNGASTTGDAILNYANRVNDAVSRYFVKETEAWKEENIQYIEENSSTEDEQFNKKTDTLREKQEAILKVTEIEKRVEDLSKLLIAPTLQIRKDSVDLLSEWNEERQLFERSIVEYVETTEEEEEAVNAVATEEERSEEAPILAFDEIIHRANKIGEILKELPDFQEAASIIKKKAMRVENQQFTIALFGAFSAGKSSFSNALMGANVLPVSPNPTTATINKIHPVTDTHLHNTADVSLKTQEQLLEDVKYAFEQLGITITSLEEAFEKAPAAVKENSTEEVHKSFINAFYIGYPAVKDKLGEVLNVDEKEFSLFVAQESKSCFVDFIDFYFDCELTRLGVTLVDTPGADSINARHTGVAFDYIRNADAVLFVTYFNHAFAKADREFLIQLGRVKDSFELDKMFFVVNAIDLASNEEEADLVKQYVKDELQRFGIRFPRVFGVSSLQALQEKENKKQLHKGMEQFEKSFHQFLEQDLKQIAVIALEEESNRQKNKLLSLIQQTEANLARKEERLTELTNQEAKIRERYTQYNAISLTKDTTQELESLLFYVLQRVYYRFNEFFKEAYNPSLFSNHNASVALDIALKDILQMIRFDLEQELRVTNFRVLQFIQRQITQLDKEEMRILKDWNGSLTFSPHESEDYELLEFVGPFQDKDKYSHVKSYFKNAKSFFEKNEKEKLRDTLSEETKVEATAYIEQEKQRLVEWLIHYADQEIERARIKWLNESLQQLAAERKLLEQEETLNRWKDIYQKIQGGGNA
ncbi:dynamin family protein [Psychrobacillus sp. BL-248-WT-3]|uniref:dynamin family protein n=1 Tax=Psychrobacillus sp. BL-248-WT-3 TaxID=2725306 RepID=UPI00146D01F8|nr:dynamin family protein [Psychrobacillus sp. BL-248-WT-3]NME05800.1 GTPase [Psychrobacillus sp. BL-248-WT-3]